MPRKAEYDYTLKVCVYASNEASAEKKLKKVIKLGTDILLWEKKLTGVVDSAELEERAHLMCSSYPNCDIDGCW